VTAGVSLAVSTRLAEAVDLVRGVLDRKLSRLADLDLMAPNYPVGGKLLRPRLLLTLALKPDDDGPHLDRLAALAATVELIHLASLHHDDVIDASPHRRQVASAREQFGNKVSILFGDAILTAALDLLLGGSSRRMQRAVARAVRETLRGEIAQHTGHRNPSISERECVRVAALKTGSLFGLAAQLGALAAGEPEPVVRLAFRMGRRLGTAYQLMDDAMDYLGNSEILGKEPGSDYRQGIATLPLVSAWLFGSPADRMAIDQSFGANGSSDFSGVQLIISRRSNIGRTRAAAFHQLGWARSAIPELGLPDRVGQVEAFCREIEDRIWLAVQH
jgi:octaprenyl-diphosphate synthase